MPIEYLMPETRQPPPARILAGGRLHSVAPLILRGDVGRLAALGVLRHVTPSGEAPLGYTDWQLAEDADGHYYTRAPAGAPEARAAALLAARKAAMQQQRAAGRLAAQTSGFAHEGHVFASDREESIPLLLNAVISAQMALAQGAEATAAFEAALGAGWRDVTGAARVTTALGLLALHFAFVAHGAACDRHSQALKAAIDAAGDAAALDAIDLEAGWP